MGWVLFFVGSKQRWKREFLRKTGKKIEEVGFQNEVVGVMRRPSLDTKNGCNGATGCRIPPRMILTKPFSHVQCGLIVEKKPFGAPSKKNRKGTGRVQIPQVLRWNKYVYVKYLFQNSYQHTRHLMILNLKIHQFSESWDNKISTGQRCNLETILP